MQEEAGRLKFVCLANDGVDEHMVWYSIPLWLNQWKKQKDSKSFSDLVQVWILNYVCGFSG